MDKYPQDEKDVVEEHLRRAQEESDARYASYKFFNETQFGSSFRYFMAVLAPDFKEGSPEKQYLEPAINSIHSKFCQHYDFHPNNRKPFHGLNEIKDISKEESLLVQYETAMKNDKREPSKFIKTFLDTIETWITKFVKAIPTQHINAEQMADELTKLQTF